MLPSITIDTNQSFKKGMKLSYIIKTTAPVNMHITQSPKFVKSNLNPMQAGVQLPRICSVINYTMRWQKDHAVMSLIICALHSMEVILEGSIVLSLCLYEAVDCMYAV